MTEAMTANPFAALLAKIGRYSHDCDEPHLVPEPDGKWLDRDEVLAALAAAVPADLAEAGEVLEGVTAGPWSIPGQPDKICAEGYTKNGFARTIATVATPSWMGSADPWTNARFIAWCREGVPALLARLAAQEAQIKGLEHDRDEWRQRAIDRCEASEKWFRKYGAEKARAEAAETALAAMTKERDELATANHRQASCIHVTAANLGPDCSATVDGLPKAARHVAAERDALLGAVKGLVEVLDQHETKGPLPDVALMFCWLAAQNVRAALRGNTLEKPE